MSRDLGLDDVASVSPTATAELASLRQQLESANDLIRRYREESSDSQKREVMLLEFVKKIKEQTPEKPDYWSPCSQCECNSSEAEDIFETLAATEPKP